MRTVTRDDGLLFCFAGASRFGKTTGVVEQIKKSQRTLVWDVRPEYEQAIGSRLLRSISELKAALRECWGSEGRFSYYGAPTDFSEFADLAYKWVMLWPATIVIEEWADLTGSGKGSGAWGELVRKGLYFGAHIYAITQRPQETDKTTWGNASAKRTYYFDLPVDQRYMSDVMGVPCESIANLARHEWLERRSGSKDVYPGHNDIGALRPC